MVGCDCKVCQSTNVRNQRYRCAVLVGTPQGNLLIDTPPELRLQLLREKIELIHAVLYTHYHADHLYGLDDVRPFNFMQRREIPIYASAETLATIRTFFFFVI